MPPASRLTDMHTCPLISPGPVPHVGGPILAPGAPTVLIGFLPAARATDECVCVGPPDAIAMGSPTVMIGGLMAARMGDPTVHGGVIILGEPTVMIGESGGGGAGGPGAGGGAAGAASVDGGLVSSLVDYVINAIKSLYNTNSDAGKAARQRGGAAVWPGKQSYNNCGVQSSGEVIAAASGHKPDENALLQESIKNGNAQDNKDPVQRGGTWPQGRQNILATHGVPSDIQPTTKDNLAKAIKGNKGIVANVDAGELWNDPQYAGGGHAVMVYDGDFDKNGNLTDVYINDTGTGKQGQKVPIDDFMRAANAKQGGSSLNVTRNPVW